MKKALLPALLAGLLATPVLAEDVTFQMPTYKIKSSTPGPYSAEVILEISNPNQVKIWGPSMECTAIDKGGVVVYSPEKMLGPAEIAAGATAEGKLSLFPKDIAAFATEHPGTDVPAPSEVTCTIKDVTFFYVKN